MRRRRSVFGSYGDVRIKWFHICHCCFWRSDSVMTISWTRLGDVEEDDEEKGEGGGEE